MKSSGLFLIVSVSILVFFLYAPPSYAQIPGVPGIGMGIPVQDFGSFSIGFGGYKSPKGEAKKISGDGEGDGEEVTEEPNEDIGYYLLARYEMAKFQAEVDYGLIEPNFFLGAVDMLYKLPTAEGVTKTGIDLGFGISAINKDPKLEDSHFGANALTKVTLADTLTAQLRYDYFFGSGQTNLITLSLSYAFF